MTNRAAMMQQLQGGPIQPCEIESSDELFRTERRLLESKTDEFLTLLRKQRALCPVEQRQ